MPKPISRAALSRTGVRLPDGARVVTEATKAWPMMAVSLKAKSAARERAFLANLKALGVVVPIPEYRFHPVRKHRLDFAWPDQKLGLEVEGGVWTRGKHGRGSGIVKDMEKACLLACQGWRLLRVTPDQLTTMETAAMVRTALLA